MLGFFIQNMKLEYFFEELFDLMLLSPLKVVFMTSLVQTGRFGFISVMKGFHWYVNGTGSLALEFADVQLIRLPLTGRRIEIFVSPFENFATLVTWSDPLPIWSQILF
ncbi:hypothetical protein LINPERHAP1_LOCUS36631 [Linum perenne]